MSNAPIDVQTMATTASEVLSEVLQQVPTSNMDPNDNFESKSREYTTDVFQNKLPMDSKDLLQSALEVLRVHSCILYESCTSVTTPLPNT
jgi:hypothetical protein